MRHGALAAQRLLGAGLGDHDAVQDGELVVVHGTMSGRQSGPFVACRPDGEVGVVFPPLGRRFAVTQTRWFRMRDG